MTQLQRQKPITAPAIGIAMDGPTMRTISRRSSRITSAAAPPASSITRPSPAFQKYIGVPKNRRASFISRAFFCPEADWAESL